MEDNKSIDQYEAWELELLFGVALEPLKMVQDSYLKERAYQIDFMKNRGKDVYARNRFLMGVGSFFLIIIFMSIWINTDNITKALVVASVLLVLGIIGIKAYDKYEKSDDEKVLAKSDEKHRQVKIKAVGLLTEEFKRVVPDNYWNYNAIHTMYTLVRDHRASNWREVCNLYDTIEHRRNLEAQSEARTELMRKTMQNSEQAVALANQAKQAAEAAVDISIIDAM